jgi:hypothetical protein
LEIVCLGDEMNGAFCGVPIAHALATAFSGTIVLGAIVAAGVVSWWFALEEARHRPRPISPIVLAPRLLLPHGAAAAACDETDVPGVIPARASPRETPSPLISVRPARLDPRPARIFCKRDLSMSATRL